MIHVLLASELPWQHHDAITFLLTFIFLGIRGLFQKSLKELVLLLVASVVARFEQILWERFGNILKQSFKRHKNSK